jgi:hypothetical protein
MSHRELVRYLVQLQLLDASNFYSEDVSIDDLTRRNLNVIIRTATQSLFVKQALDADARRTLSNEARTYRIIWLWQPPPSLLPRLRHFDPDKAILVIEALPHGSEDLDTVNLTAGLSNSEVEALAKAVGSIHAARMPRYTSSDRPSVAASDMPWVFAISTPSLGVFREMSGGCRAIISQLQQQKHSCRRLTMLAQIWSPSTFIHGDLRWANIVCCPPPRASVDRDIKIVDWENAGTGDPGWDIASYFAACLCHWVSAMDFLPGRSVTESAALSDIQLQDLQPAMRIFWSTYRTVCGLDAVGDQNLLERVARFMGARLIQLAIERSQCYAEPSASALVLCQLGCNVLERPEVSLANLLNLGYDRRG